mgnify:CR=1 FL=1
MYLDDTNQKILRDRGIITENEAVAREGDLFVAVNVISNERRIIQVDERILESKNRKELLKG